MRRVTLELGATGAFVLADLLLNEVCVSVAGDEISSDAVEVTIVPAATEDGCLKDYDLPENSPVVVEVDKNDNDSEYNMVAYFEPGDTLTVRYDYTVRGGDDTASLDYVVELDEDGVLSAELENE